MKTNGLWNHYKFRTFKEAVERVEEFSNDLECNISITQEPDNSYAFFGNGKTIATWVCGDREDDLEFHGIYRKPSPKKSYLRHRYIEEP